MTTSERQRQSRMECSEITLEKRLGNVRRFIVFRMGFRFCIYESSEAIHFRVMFVNCKLHVLKNFYLGVKLIPTNNARTLNCSMWNYVLYESWHTGCLTKSDSRIVKVLGFLWRKFVYWFIFRWQIQWK